MKKKGNSLMVYMPMSMLVSLCLLAPMSMPMHASMLMCKIMLTSILLGWTGDMGVGKCEVGDGELGVKEKVPVPFITSEPISRYVPIW